MPHSKLGNYMEVFDGRIRCVLKIQNSHVLCHRYFEYTLVRLIIPNECPISQTLSLSIFTYCQGSPLMRKFSVLAFSFTKQSDPELILYSQKNTKLWSFSIKFSGSKM